MRKEAFPGVCPTALLPFMQPPKVPHTPVSLEGNTEGSIPATSPEGPLQLWRVLALSPTSWPPLQWRLASSSIHSSAYLVWPSSLSLLSMLWPSPCSISAVVFGSLASAFWRGWQQLRVSLPHLLRLLFLPFPPTQNTLDPDFYVMQSLTSSRFLLQCCFPDHLVEKSVRLPLCVHFPALFSPQLSSSLDLLHIYSFLCADSVLKSSMCLTHFILPS